MTGRRILSHVIPTQWAVDIDDELSLRHAEAACRSFGLESYA